MPGYLFDTCVWVALFFEAHPGHGAALDAFDTCSADHPASFCRATEQSFVRILTLGSIQAAYGCSGLSNADVAGHLKTLQAAPAVARIDREPRGTRDCWLELASRETASAKVWMDAYLAAFAIRGAMPLVTLDQDFGSFRERGLNLTLLET